MVGQGSIVGVIVLVGTETAVAVADGVGMTVSSTRGGWLEVDTLESGTQAMTIVIPRMTKIPILDIDVIW